MKVLASVLSLCVAASAGAAVVSTTQHGPDATSLDGSIAVGDAISGLIGTELAGDLGWHGANTLPADRLPAFTDDLGINPPGGSGLTGLLNDFPPTLGDPVKRVQYSLAGPTDIPAIKVLSGNNGKDGRVFSTTVVSYSTNGGGSFTPLGYFQSDPSGTVNAGTWGSTLVTIFDNSGAALATGVTDVIIEFFAVDNTGGQMRDPFDGVNPYTGLDDGLTAAFVSPLIFEVDVLPEPASLSLLGLGGLAMLRRR